MKWYRQTLCLGTIAIVASVLCGPAFGQSPLGCSSGGCGDSSGPLIIFIGADRDIAGMGQFRSVANDFCSRGYNAVYFDPWKQLNDDEALADVIRHAVKCRHQRVMLVGWSYGTVVGLKALQRVESEGICVDTFVELDCFNLRLYMGEYFHPSNAGRVIVVRSKLNKPPAGYGCAEIHRLDSPWHLGVPTHEHTTCMLTTEANRLFCSSCGEPLAQSSPVQSAVPIKVRATLASDQLQRAATLH